MKKLLAMTAIGLSLAAAPVLAGNASMKNRDGVKLRINCTNAGCKVRQKAPGGKWATLEKTEGGVENFKVLEAKYKGEGYK